MNTILRKSLPAAVTATIVAGAFGIPALAEGGGDGTGATGGTAVLTATEGEGGDHAFGRGFGRGLEEGELAERLAAELGLDADTVQAAIDAVKGDLATERLAAQVEDGRLTQEQADRIAAAIEEGDAEALQEIRDEVRLEHLQTRLDEQVEAGELTEEEAADILERAEAGDFPRRGHHGHRGPRRGGPEGDAPTDGDGATEGDTTSA